MLYISRNIWQGKCGENDRIKESGKMPLKSKDADQSKELLKCLFNWVTLQVVQNHKPVLCPR